ncbi:hypothetical protein ACFORG_03670 [Lutimaribacter marinistellae]|uniref:Hemolysin-type calcium-binding repeat-containing protein n=1 Tax=Lutimaribacter marinistellae TaxID=1820329 RepID=A0ABV7TGC3_9RHOB
MTWKQKLKQIIADLPAEQLHRGSKHDEELNGTAWNDFLSGNKGDDIVRAAGGDFARGGKGNDVVDGSCAPEGSETHLEGNRGNDRLIGGAGNDSFGAVNGSNTVTTGGGNDTVIVTFRQEKMEKRNADYESDGGDHFTTVTDFDVTKDTLHVTGIRAAKADLKLEWVASENGIILQTAADGNKLVELLGVTMADVDALNVDFGGYNWFARRAEVLTSEPAESYEDGPSFGTDDSIDLAAAGDRIDLKDGRAQTAIFDFGEAGDQSFFHGDLGRIDDALADKLHLTRNGSSVQEKFGEVESWLDAVKMDVEADAFDPLEVLNIAQDQIVLTIDNGSAVDTIALRGQQVEDFVLAEYGIVNPENFDTRVDLKDKWSSDGGASGSDFTKQVALFDFAEDDRNPDKPWKGGQSFFHGSDGGFSKEVREFISGSSLSEGEVESFVFGLLNDRNGDEIGEPEEIEVQLVTEKLIKVDFSTDRATDTIILQGEVVENAIQNWQSDSSVELF